MGKKCNDYYLPYFLQDILPHFDRCRLGENKYTARGEVILQLNINNRLEITFRLLSSLIFLTVLVSSRLICNTIFIIRSLHSSWASPSGIILMGGSGSKRTTEIIQEDGTSIISIDLQYNTV